MVLRGAWFGREALGAPALVPRVRGEAFEARASDAGRDAGGLSCETSEAGSLRRSEVRGNVEGETGAGRRRALSEPGKRASGAINVFSPGNAGGGRAEGAVSPSTCQSPVVCPEANAPNGVKRTGFSQKFGASVQ